MADGKIKTLIDEYEELLARKSELYKLSEKNKEDIRLKADELCQAISDAGLKNASDGDYLYTPGVQHKYYLRKDEDLPEGIEDKYAVFESDPALADLVKKDINWQRLQTSMRELEDSGEGIPDEVLAVLNVQDEFGISRRKTDTSAKTKVADALKKRRAENA